MFKILGDDFEKRIFNEINHSIEKKDKNIKLLEDTTRENNKIDSELYLIKKELLDYLTLHLNNNAEDRISNLNEFINPIQHHPHLIDKSLKDDFMYLFIDSLDNLHILYPQEVMMVFVYSHKVKADVFRNFEESEARMEIDNLINHKFNWLVEIDKADSVYLMKREKIVAVPTFTYLWNGRKTHPKMKLDKCFVFKRNENTERLFEIRNIILKILNIRVLPRNLEIK